MNEITNADKKYDLKMCEKTVKISLDALFLYYKNKNCFYIQIEKSGIYYLAQDLGVIHLIKTWFLQIY